MPSLHWLKELWKDSRARFILLAFIGVQLVLWAKLALVGIPIGTYTVERVARIDLGIMDAPEFLAETPERALHFAFHQTVHVLVFALAFAFGWNARFLRKRHALALAMIGTALHNAGYWVVEAPYRTLAFNVADFARDFLLLVAVLLGAQWLAKRWKKPQTP